jgi:hypothetical protein
LENKKYRENNIENVKKSRKEHYQKNIEKMREEKNNYGKKHRKEKSEYDKSYRIKNKEKIKKIKKEWEYKMKDDPIFKLKRNMRRRVCHTLKGNLKKDKTFNLVGCYPEELKQYLESQFSDQMTWENYGKVWHVDHIIMLQEFDFSKEEEIRLAFHYTNLRPLLANDNMSRKFNHPRQTEQTPIDLFHY